MAMYNYTPNANYYGANESEEERRRREAEQLAAQNTAQSTALQLPALPQIEQPGVAVAPVEPEPIKQTITYDPVSGEQRMKIEGNARDLSAENPLTPTLTMPGAVSPEQMAQQQERKAAAIEQQQREAQAQAQAQAQQPMPQPGPAVQVASVAPDLPQTQPAQPQYTGPGQGAEAQTVGMPAPQPAAEQPVQKTAVDLFAEAAGDTNKLLQIYNDKNQSPELRRMAGREAGRMLESENRRAEAEDEVKNMSETEIARLLKSKSEEGSWGKRVLFGLLNMQAAMAQEDAKLGIGAKYQSTNLDGTPVLVKVRADGVPMEGFNATTGKKLSAKELVGATAQMTAVKGTEVEAGTYLDPTGTVKGNWVLERRPGGSVYRQVGTNAIATAEQANALRKTGVQGTLADQSARQVQELQNKLNFAGPNASAAEREKIIAESEARFGLLPEAYKAQIRGAAPQPAAAPVQAQAAPGQAQATAPAVQAGQAQTQRAPAPVAAQAAPGGGVRLSVVPGGTPGARESQQRIGEAAATAQIQGAKEVAVAEAKVPAEERGKVAARAIAKQGFADSTYPLLSAVREEISKSTGSAVGAGVDELARAVGASTRGAEAIAKLNVLAGPIKMNIPRFEGAQSDRDVQEYARQAGDFANPKLTVRERLAALDAMETLLSKYDKAGNNDWTYGRKAPSDGTTSSGNKYKRVQ